MVQTDVLDPVTAGRRVTYEFTAMNSGPSDAKNVFFNDILPTGTDSAL